MESNDALALIFARNMFYRRLHFLVLWAFLISLLVIGMLIGTIVYLKRNPAHPYYFAADNVSRLLQIIPVTTPNMPEDQIRKWTTKAVQAAFTFDFVNYHSQLQHAQRFFTTYGWQQYMNALISSNNLVGVVQGRRVAIAQVVDQPKLLIQALLGGAWAWKYQMNVLVTYTNVDDNTSFANAWTVTVIVQRQNPLQGNDGLGIVQLIAQQADLPVTNAPQELTNTPGG